MEAQKSLKEDLFLWVLVLLAVLLGGGYYFFLTGESSSPQKPTWIFSGVEAGTIEALRSYREDELLFEIRRTPGDTFTVTSRPRGARLNRDHVQAWIDTLLNPTIRRRFKGDPQANYGFDSTGRRIEIEQGGRTHVLYVGGEQPVGNGFYLRYGQRPDGPHFVLPTRQRDKIVKDLMDLRRRDLFVRPATSVRSFTLETDAETVRYRNVEGVWRRVVPDSAALNDTESRRVTEGLRRLTFTRVTEFYDQSTPEELTPVRARVHLGYETGDTVTMKVGGFRGKDRVVQVTGWPPAALQNDPAGTVLELPKLPRGWPEEPGDDNGSGRGDRVRQAPPSGLPGSPGGLK